MIIQLLTGMVLYVLVLYKLFSFYSKRYNPRDPKKSRFGHRPRMKYITKLSCGQIIERLQTDSGNMIKYEFGEEEEGSYTLTVNGVANCRGRAEYKVVIVPEQEWNAVYFLITDYKASPYALGAFAWELKGVLEKKLEAVRVE